MMRKPMTIPDLIAQLETLEAAGWLDASLRIRSQNDTIGAVAAIELDPNGRGTVTIWTMPAPVRYIVKDFEGGDVAVVSGSDMRAGKTVIYIWNHTDECHEPFGIVELSEIMGDDLSEFYYSVPHVLRNDVVIQSVR